ncbi:MAG: hypothetical protein JXQ87_17850 [Bacteroidia bacterium]
MTKSILTILLFIFGLTDCFSQLSKTEYEDVVEYFVNCIKNSDIDKLDSIITYPIDRPYPIPPIKNKQELEKRYSETFDDSLIAIISNSNVKEDWTDIGWRGIMLNNGIVWLDYDGRFVTTNYTSQKEKLLQEKLINFEKELLYTDLKDFEKPIHTLETEKFIVRIDLLENQKYRYASWSIESDISNKPDLVINNGERTNDGSGGNHYFTFKNGEYSYKVFVNVMGTEDTPLFNLEVSKNDKVILNQPAELKQIK